MEMRESKHGESAEDEFDCLRYWGSLPLSISNKGCFMAVVFYSSLSLFLHLCSWFNEYGTETVSEKVD